MIISQLFHTPQPLLPAPLTENLSLAQPGTLGLFFFQHKLTQSHKKVQQKEEKAHWAADGERPKQLRGFFPA